MTFEAFETSRQKGSPVELYYFRYGSDPAAFIAYAAHIATIEGPGSLDEETITYAPLAISREAITSSGTLDKAELELRTPRDSALADLFRVYPPSSPVTAIVRAGHLEDGDGEFPAVWVGRLLTMRLEGSEAVFPAEPISTSLRRNGLRQNYQLGCPHALYLAGPGRCNADRSAATIGVNATSGSGTILTMPEAWFGAIPIEKYIGGTVEWTDDEYLVELRQILRIVDGRDLQLAGVIRGLDPGGLVSVTLGCNHQEDDCRDLHVEAIVGGPNVNNYGGQKWIPVKNPFRENLYYGGIETS